MAVRDGEKQLGANIPESLMDALDALTKKREPWTKTLLIAAALTEFLGMAEDDQDSAVLKARRWWRITNGTATNDEVVDQAIAEIDEEGDGRHDGQQQRSG